MVFMLEQMETGKIFKTKNYKMFKLFAGNRKIQHRPDLLRSIADRGLVNPIIVDSQYRVIDGQHRLHVCELLGIPVEYTVRSFSEDAIIDMNINQKSWVLDDYLTRYVNQDNSNYVTLKSLMETYKLNLKQTLLVLNCGLNPAKKDKDVFRFGRFKISPSEVQGFHSSMQLLTDIFKTNDGENENLFRYGNLFSSLVLIVNHPNYKHEFFLDRLSETPTHKLKVRGTRADVCRSLEDIYNNRLKSSRIELVTKKNRIRG